MTGRIIIENYEGTHNNPDRYKAWSELGLYRNLSTILVCPTRGTCSTRVAFSWMNLMGGFNAPLVKMCIDGYEVGEAYNQALIQILTSDQLKGFQYLLTLEEDNTVSPDSLIKLYQGIEKYDVLSGLYWLKGPDGCPQIWGDPSKPNDFTPQPITGERYQECNGTGMGFALFRMDMFKNPGFEFGKWFRTKNENNQAITQDLYFAKRARELGYKFAVDTHCKIGHLDLATGEIW
jgi:hypothetical protein